jgi:hypothetical protein
VCSSIGRQERLGIIGQIIGKQDMTLFTHSYSGSEMCSSIGRQERLGIIGQIIGKQDMTLFTHSYCRYMTKNESPRQGGST